MKDYRLKVAIKNNYLLTAIEKKGFWSVGSLCAAYDCLTHKNTVVGRIANLKLSLYNSRGAIRPIFLTLSRILGCLPEDLIPPQHLETALAKNTGELEVTLGEIQAILPGYWDAPRLPDADIEQQEFLKCLERSLDTLQPRQKFVIERRFGLDGEAPGTFEDIGNVLGVTRERVRQIEVKALRCLKRPRISRELCDSAPPEFGLALIHMTGQDARH